MPYRSHSQSHSGPQGAEPLQRVKHRREMPRLSNLPDSAAESQDMPRRVFPTVSEAEHPLSDRQEEKFPYPGGK